jgi:ferredoxin
MAGAKVRLAGEGQAFDAPEGEDLLEVLRSNGHSVETGCGGVASCGLCRITVEVGGEHLSPVRADERDRLGAEAQILGTRLACQAKVRTMGTSLPPELVVRVPGLGTCGGNTGK